jgi:hypothetical protein
MKVGLTVGPYDEGENDGFDEEGLVVGCDDG